MRWFPWYSKLAISPILSKVFEYCLLDKCIYFWTDCWHTIWLQNRPRLQSRNIYIVRTIVEFIVRKGSIVNLCAIDLSKAFDKVNLHALFIKLMKRNVPVQVLGLLENMLFDCHSCVKWENVYSDFFTVMFGVRQGSVLAPFLFAVFLYDELSDTSLYRLCTLSCTFFMHVWCVNSIKYEYEYVI